MGGVGREQGLKPSEITWLSVSDPQLYRKALLDHRLMILRLHWLLLAIALASVLVLALVVEILACLRSPAKAQRSAEAAQAAERRERELQQLLKGGPRPASEGEGEGEGERKSGSDGGSGGGAKAKSA